MRRIAILAMAAGVMIAAPAAAETRAPGIGHDVQCFVAASSLLASSDKQVQQTGMMGSVYFAGKIFGADPKVDLAATLAVEAPALTGERLSQLRVECGTELMQRGKQISAAGEALDRLEKQQGGK